MIITIRSLSHIFVTAAVLFWASSPVHAAVKATPATSVTKTALGSITEELADSSVEIEATVKSITMPREGSKAPVRINLTDASGAMTMVVWADTFDIIKAQTSIAAGTIVHATANVSKYKDTLQLQLRRPTDIRVVSQAQPSAPAPESAPAHESAPTEPSAGNEGLTNVGDITNAMMGRDVTVKATISDVREPRSEKAPYIVNLTQNDTRIALVFWSDMEAQIKPGLKVGNVVRVKAQVGEHRGNLQIKLRNAADFTVVSSEE